MDQISRSFYDSLREKEIDEVFDILYRYDGYQAPMVEAALNMLFDRGAINFETKDAIERQVTANMSADWNRSGMHQWESNNAFLQLFRMADDEKLYSLLDNPGGMIIDVYHGLLLASKERELISEHDFASMYSNAKDVNRSQYEIESDAINDFYGMEEKEPEEYSKEELEKEALKYWKCPSCGEMSEMEFSQCWKCGAVSPENIQHPSVEEVIKSKVDTGKTGIRQASFVLMALGLLGCTLIFARAGSVDNLFDHRPVRTVSVIIVLLVGIGLFIKSLAGTESDDTASA